MNLQVRLNEIERSKQKVESVSLGVFFLFMEIVFCFINNHKALFIADYYIFLLLFVGYILFKRQGTMRIHPIMLSLIIVFVTSLLFFSMVDRGTLLSYIIWIIVMNLGLSYKFNKKELSCMMWGFVIGSLIMAILVIAQQHHFYYPGSYRFSIQLFNNEEVDPNYLAAFMYLGAIFSIHNLLDKKQKKKYLLTLFLIIILIAIFMTGSRAVYVALAIALFGIMLRTLKNGKKNGGSILLFLLVCFLLVIIVSTKISDEIIERFDFSTLMDASNLKRLQHWKAAVIAFFKNPLLGYGASHTMSILSTFANHSSDAHNTFFTILLHFGLIGSIPIFSLLLKIFNRFRNKRSTEWFFYFLGFLFINFIVANHLGISFWLPILIFYQLSSRKEFENVECSGSGV